MMANSTGPKLNLFGWLRKHHIGKLADQAREYLSNNFADPEKEGKTQYSRDDVYSSEHQSTTLYSVQADDSEPHVQFQRWDIDEPDIDQKDNYNSSAIQQTIRAISDSTPSSGILKKLDANTNMTFVEKLLEHISKRHMRDSDVYKAAQIDRRLFSKIVSDREYKPAKDTCVAFAFALRLSLPEAEDLLSRAGYTLSHSSKRDVVIEYFFKERIYDLNDVNGVLYQLEQKVIGR